MGSYRRTNILPIFLLALLMVGACNARADTIKLITGTPENSRSFRIANALVKAIGQKMGRQITLVHIPNKRSTVFSIAGTKYHGEVARIAGYSELQPDLIQVKEPIAKVKYYAFTKSLIFEVNGWESLTPYSVVYTRGNLVAQTNLLPTTKKTQPINTTKQGIKFMLAGRADVLVSTFLASEQIMQSPELANQGIVRLEPAIDTITFHTYFNHKFADIAEQYNAGLIAIKKNGTHRLIFEQVK